MSLPVLALCIFWLPSSADYFHYPVLFGLYLTALFYFMALYQTMKLLGYIDRNQAFSDLSVKALKNIKHCAAAISVTYTVMLPLIYPIADADDAPGVLAIAIIFVFASAAVAVFSAVLQRLLRDAIDIKSENDLTV
ncbi:MAG: DUF2975 domain-containing protein [Youngiibacter sp.]|nr:DUF2975 domain-containing protein [Youngiibacter sp.]